MSKLMDDVMLAAENEPTSGKAIATVINGIAALVETAGTDAASLRVAVREIRREAAALQEIVERKAGAPDVLGEEAPKAAAAPAAPAAAPAAPAVKK